MHVKVREFLVGRGIDPQVALDLCVGGDDKEIWYPITDAKTGACVGHKRRQFRSRKMYMDVSGVKISDTLPMVYQHDANWLLICEGESDFLRASSIQTFVVDTLCCPGATSFPAEWVGLCTPYDEVFVCPDADEAGLKMAQRITSLIPTARIVRLPDGMDLTDYLNLHGEAMFLGLMSTATHMPAPKKVRRSSFVYDTGQASQYKSRLLDFVVKDVQLSKRGTELVGKCPFHKEETPSFFINADKGLYYCHGCNAAGDVVSYVRKRYDVPFVKAMHMIKEIR